jgi:hypothetical protein
MMRVGESYRLKAETLGPETAVRIPKDAIVTIVAGHADGDRTVDVSWNGQATMLFVQDLLDRGELVEGSASPELQNKKTVLVVDDDASVLKVFDGI